MNDTVRVGLVGADAGGRGWGPVAHMPALREVDQAELTALCTSRPESAAAAAEAYGIRAYHDVGELAAQPDIDLIAVAVRVPSHMRTAQSSWGRESTGVRRSLRFSVYPRGLRRR